MKYIHKRSNFNKINEELMDSTKLDVDFSDTMLGGTLHRLMGFGRSVMKSRKMNKYSRELDRLLSSIVLSRIEEQINKDNPNTDNIITIEKLEKDAPKLLGTKTLLLGMQLYLEGDKEGAVKQIGSIPNDTVKYLESTSPDAQKFIESINTDIEKSQSDEDGGDQDQDENDNTDIEKTEGESQDGNDNTDIEETEGESQDGNDNTDVENTESKGQDDSSDRKDDKKSDESKEERLKKMSEYVNKQKEKYKKLLQFCYRCKDKKSPDVARALERFLPNIKSTIESFESMISDGEELNDEVINKLNLTFKKAYKLCEKCDVDGSIKESFSYLLENSKPNTNNDDDNPILDQKAFDRIKKALNKEAKNWKVTEEDLKKIEEAANQTEKTNQDLKLTGNQSKHMMEILTNVKNSMLHTKPYSEIRKKQQRWFDKLPSGRAISRKGYQQWVKKLNEITGYFKDQLPENVLSILSDSLDKVEIDNDYVNLNRKVLGIKPKDNTGSRNWNNNNNNRNSNIDDKNFVTDYKKGDIIHYQKSNGEMNKGEVISIGKKEVEVKTDKGVFNILKTRIKEVEKK